MASFFPEGEEEDNPAQGLTGVNEPWANRTGIIRVLRMLSFWCRLHVEYGHVLVSRAIGMWPDSFLGEGHLDWFSQRCEMSNKKFLVMVIVQGLLLLAVGKFVSPDWLQFPVFIAGNALIVWVSGFAKDLHIWYTEEP